MFARRLFAALLPLLLLTVPAAAAESSWDLLDEPGTAVLLRHASAPGTGDPAGFVPGDCATQRNLNERGRAQARAIGEAFRARGITAGRAEGEGVIVRIRDGAPAVMGRLPPPVGN